MDPVWSFVLGFWLFHCELSFLSPDSGFICHVMFGLTLCNTCFSHASCVRCNSYQARFLCFCQKFVFCFLPVIWLCVHAYCFVTVLPYQLLRLLLRSSDKLIFFWGWCHGLHFCLFFYSLFRALVSLGLMVFAWRFEESL